MPTKTYEREATLIICSERPRAVRDAIARLSSIAAYRCVPQDTQQLSDVYLDLPDHALQSHRLALRIRAMDTRHWVTLKGPGRQAEWAEWAKWGGVERFELELPWSETAFARMLSELEARGISLSRRPQGFSTAHPLDTLLDAGFGLIQERQTDRVLRNIVQMGDGREPILAELALDAVRYQLGDQQVYHHEVEIEEKAQDGIVVLKTVSESLTARFGPALRRWEHNKVATGRALEELRTQGILTRLLDAENHLKPAAYDTIDRYLRQTAP